MIHKNTSAQKIQREGYKFTRIEYRVPDDLRETIEEEIRNLTSEFDLACVRDDGKMVKLSPDGTKIYNAEGRIPGLDAKIETHFGHLYRPATPEDFLNQPENCAQVTRQVPELPDSVTELIANQMSEVIRGLTEHIDDPYSYLVITNAPIGFPFGQKDDSRYQKFFPNNVILDRHPIAEAFQYGLLKASGHSIDAPFPGRAYAPVTPNLSKVANVDNRVWEEESSSQPFYTHIDGANYDEYSSQVCLAFGTGGKGSETNLVHIEAVLDELDEMDTELGLFSNGMGREEVLKLDIFKHGPGFNSTCMNVVEAPVLFEDLDGALRPRMNLTDGRVIIRDDKIPGFGLTKDDVEEAVKALASACDNPVNQHTIILETGQVVCFSGELPHGRSAFSADEDDPRFAIRLRGTSEMHCALIEERNRLNPDRPAHSPGR